MSTSQSANQESIQSQASGRILRILIISGVTLAVLVVGYFVNTRRENKDALLAEAHRAMAAGQYQEVDRLCQKLLEQDPNHQAGLYLAGHSLKMQDQHEQALEYLERIEDDDSLEAVQARCLAGDIYMGPVKHLEAAIRQFRRAIKQQPDNDYALESLAYALGIGSQNWDTIPHRLKLIKQESARLPQLYALSLGERVMENPELVSAFHQVHPEDPIALVGMGRALYEVKRYEQAEKLLRHAIKLSPQLTEAYVRLGKLLIQTGDRTKFVTWHLSVTPDMETHPEIWLCRGNWARAENQTEVAVRCYWEAVRRNPDDSQSNYQLGRMLVSLGDSEIANAYLERARLLELYVKSAEIAYNTQDIAEFRKSVKFAENCGLLFEAYGWAQAAAQFSMQSQWAHEAVQRLKPQLANLELQRSIPDANSAAKMDLAKYPLPDWGTGQPGTLVHNSDSGSSDTIHFDDRAQSTGLDFRYYNAGTPLKKGIVMMYEVVGGGAAVLDYDCDGWPDLYLPQGCPWPPQPDQKTHLDPLYRNTGEGRFEEVSRLAGLAENRFSQGATIGDYNADGFPDIHVTNIGENRLYENNGDGTFTDITQTTQIGGTRYSVSSVLVDLNADRWPDLYVVNYLSGDDLFTKVCGDNQGIEASCLPQIFPAAQDQIYVNQGDGSFKEATAESGIVAENGKGLGIVAADFSGNGRLNLFIANDVAPNFYFVNQTEQAGAIPQFREEGLLRGLALNFRGQYESSMGVAAGYANADGLLDLFITNFDNESNTLYQQTDGNLFTDETQQAALQTKQHPFLGWGTQFVDGDLDGRQDLILTNGHINDLRHKGRPYRMPPQFFRSIGKGQFVEVAGNTLGSFFQKKYLGRGLARLDWNRDGKEDVIISHLDTPVALLTNTSKKTGNSISFKFVATRSARDAIGTQVQFSTGKQTITRQLTAGDGNQVSNERVIIVGLAKANRVEDVTVRWPAGSVQKFSDLAANSQWLLVEGRDEPVLLHKTHSTVQTSSK